MRRTLNLGRLAGLLSIAVALVACQQIRAGDVVERLPHGTPELHRAAALDDTANVLRLAPRGVNATGPYGWTPLHYAAIFRARGAARTLVAARAHLDPVDATGMTPLHWAARKGDETIVKLLLEAGAEVMARNAFDMTPLHEATTTPVALALLARGADLHARDLDGMTPLHTAPTREVAQLLIAKGADVNARSKDGRTPLDMPPAALPRVE